jgi:hypothetical protein
MRREEEISEQKLGGTIRVSACRVRVFGTRRDETKTKTLPATRKADSSETAFDAEKTAMRGTGRGQITEVCIDVAV